MYNMYVCFGSKLVFALKCTYICIFLYMYVCTRERVNYVHTCVCVMVEYRHAYLHICIYVCT